ncbi:MAG: hypothetical protein Ct9H90mP9_4850 [Pseudomonadota bacterium]|nr:MAG: hypothetical protein Ct9H90mP9_4850 [Pseudomonadota bacterium]
MVDRGGQHGFSDSQGGWLQSSPVIPELGFCFNSRAQMFWLRERGFRQHLRRENVQEPPSPQAWRFGMGKVTSHTELPEGPAGPVADIFLLRHLLGEKNLQEAIDAPSFSLPNIFLNPSSPVKPIQENWFWNPVLKKKLNRELEERGHQIQVGMTGPGGRMCAVSQKGGLFKAAANPRGMQGYAVGR